MLTNSSGKHLEDAHFVSLMYKLKTSARGCDDLSFGFDRDLNRRKRELTNNKNQKGEYHLRFMLRDIFGFFEQQEKTTYGLGYKLTLTRGIDNCVLNKNNAVNNVRFTINSFEWYVPPYTPSISQQVMLFKQILSITPAEFQYIERTVFLKEVNTQIFWSFEFGTQEGINFPIWIVVGFA